MLLQNHAKSAFVLFAQDINFGATVSAGVFGTLSVVAGVIGVVGFRKIRSLRSDTLILRSKLAGAVDAHSKTHHEYK